MQDLMHYRHTYLDYCVDKKTKINKKRPGLAAHFYKT